MNKGIFINWMESAIVAYNKQGDERAAVILQEGKDKAVAGVFDADTPISLRQRPDVATRSAHDDHLRGWFSMIPVRTIPD